MFLIRTQTQHVENMMADYGGTEIRSAFAFALGARNTRLPTVAFVLTDGEVTQLIQFQPVRSSPHSLYRLWTLITQSPL